MTNNEDDYYDEYDYGEESYYGFKGGEGKRSKGKSRGKKGGKFPTFEFKGKPKGKKESTLERHLKMERQTLQALSQLLKPILMPPMVRLGMNLHMEFRIHTVKTGVTHIMTVQLVIHGTQRMASVSIWPPMKEELS